MGKLQHIKTNCLTDTGPSTFLLPFQSSSLTRSWNSSVILIRQRGGYPAPSQDSHTASGTTRRQEATEPVSVSALLHVWRNKLHLCELPLNTEPGSNIRLYPKYVKSHTESNSARKSSSYLRLFKLT